MNTEKMEDTARLAARPAMTGFRRVDDLVEAGRPEAKNPAEEDTVEAEGSVDEAPVGEDGL